MSVNVQKSPMIRDRREFAALCNYHELFQAWEIGVDNGDFAWHFLRSWRGYSLHLVDPYEPYHEMPWPRDSARQLAVSRLTEHANRIRFVHKASPDVIATIPIAWHVQFVYIDGDHRYGPAKTDIEAWWKRLTPGGILAGHDYCDEHEGVIRAVNELADREGLTVYLTWEGNTAPSWYVMKEPA